MVVRQITLLLLLMTVIANLALAQTVVVGTVYAIAEQDAEQEIKQRAANVDWEKVYSKPSSQWSGLVSVRLPNAQSDNERHHAITYTVEQDIIDRQGNILYPKGYIYNSLDYISMPYRILIIGDAPEHIEWARQQARDADEIWTAGGNPRHISQVLEGRPVFILTEDSAEKLALRAVPTVISQAGNQLLLEERYVPVQ